jgi:hypothetical protein
MTSSYNCAYVYVRDCPVSVEMQMSAGLRGARRQMPVDGVVAEVRASADEPFRERRTGIVEHLRYTASASRRGGPSSRRTPRDPRASAGGNSAYVMARSGSFAVIAASDT